MHITFNHTVTKPKAITTFHEGKTYTMPDAMAQGFIESGAARPAGGVQTESPAEPEPTDDATDAD